MIIFFLFESFLAFVVINITFIESIVKNISQILVYNESKI